MARPTKSNADYFKHDNDMRNDPKVKALRGKFGLEGYAIWNMILETLTDADGFLVDWNGLSIELFSGDFGIASERLEEVVAYMEKIGLIQIDSEKLACKNLSIRMQSVVEKREKMHERYFLRVSAAETTQKRREEKREEEKTTKETSKESEEVDSEIEEVIETLKAEKEKPPATPGAGPGREPGINTDEEIAQIAADFRMKEAFEKKGILPAKFTLYLDAFKAQIDAIEERHESRKRLREHFLNYSSKRWESEKKNQPLPSTAPQEIRYKNDKPMRY